MTQPDQLLAMIKRFQEISESDVQHLKDLVDGGNTEAAKQFFNQLVEREDVETVRQLGKYNINSQESRGAQIGDVFHITLNETQNSNSDKEDQEQQLTLNWQDLELNIDPDVVKSINAKLSTIHRLYVQDQLAGEVEREFLEIKNRIRIIESIEQELVLLESRADRLLDDLKDDLSQDLQHLNNRFKQAATQHEKETISRTIDDVKARIAMVQDFYQMLIDGRPGADWIDDNLSDLANLSGAHALKSPLFSRLRIRNEQDIEDFYYSIEQYLERISHCLKWGRYNILDSLDIPLVYDPDEYLKAFKYIEKLIPMHLEDSTKAQIQNCLAYLLTTISR